MIVFNVWLTIEKINESEEENGIDLCTEKIKKCESEDEAVAFYKQTLKDFGVLE